MMAAAAAAANGHNVLLLERNEKLGKKLYITGKGRCNITNDADIEEFFENIPRNAKFLYSAMYGFDNRAVVELINAMGVPTKVERGKRVFPVSDKSSDVIRALSRHLEKSGAKVRLNAAVEAIERHGEGFRLNVGGEWLSFDAVVICTGGASYPSTGSTGAGYGFARELGHTVTDIKPSLIPLVTAEKWPSMLTGLSLKNVTLTAFDRRGRRIYQELGEMLFTHFGVSGPLVLSASSRMADNPAGASLEIDLKPGLSPEELDRRVLRDLAKYQRRQMQNALAELLPARLIPVILEVSGISPELPANSLTKADRRALCAILKALPLTVDGTRGVEEAIITRGGVNVKEINPSTMESRLVPGLYFAGEVLDVDAYTGGFNLQIAYSTGILAGRSI